jgi:hypothetical protein
MHILMDGGERSGTTLRIVRFRPGNHSELAEKRANSINHHMRASLGDLGVKRLEEMKLS